MIKIYYNKKVILEDLFEININLSFFKKNNIFVYFPFDDEILKDKKKIISQINKDEKNIHPKKIVAEINKFLKIHEKQIINSLKISNYYNFKIGKKYKVFLNYYGCDGYYKIPDIIVVNIYNKTAEYILETIFHELIHLLIFESQKDKSFKNIEKTVDEIFVKSGLRKFFSNYKVQQIK